MKSKFIVVGYAALAAAFAMGINTVRSATNETSGFAIPLIVMTEVPLGDAIKNLARQAELNFILDPRVPGPGIGPGSRGRMPTVTVRYEDLTARQALDRVLKDHNLILVANPATTIARIAPAGAGVKPIPANQVGADTNGVIPLIVVDEVPLADVIINLAKQAKLNYSLDSAITAPASEFRGGLSFRWENVTARQALAAVVDNFDLVALEDPGISGVRFTRKHMEK